MTRSQILPIWLLSAALGGCTLHAPKPPTTTRAHQQEADQPRQAPTRTPLAATTATPVMADSASTVRQENSIPATVTQATTSVTHPTPLMIEVAAQTGNVENPALHEISGLAVSRQTPGVLFALNDSGNAAELYAMSETGADLGHWQINARHRDWEDLAQTSLQGQNYLVIADTGDNLQRRRQSVLYLVAEPSLGTPASTVLEPHRTFRFQYEDGPRNVEALAISDGIVYLISKEAVAAAAPQPSRLYTLPLPERETDELLIAQFAGELPLAPTNLEARLAAALAGVDLNHPTALDFDASSNTAYLLTYRHVLRIKRHAGQSWVEALTGSSERIHSHTLRQAEALAVSAGQSIWLTSEHKAAPLWALPIRPPS